MRYRRIMAQSILIWWACLSLIGACAPEPQTVREPVGTATLPAAAAPAAAVPTAFPTPESSLALQPQSSPSNLRYKIDAVLNWTSHTLRVKEAVHYVNDTGDTQPTLVFNVDINQEPSDLIIRRITNAGHPISTYTLEQTRLEVPLFEPLATEDEIDLTLEFQLSIPPLVDGYWGQHVGYWGYTSRQVNLGMWFPLLAAFDPARGWITPEEHWLGECFVLRTADFVVDLTIQGTDNLVRVAGPGELTRPAKGQWRLELENARELALSLSEEFHVLSTSTVSGVDVALYYLPDAETLDAPRHALRTAVDALSLYEELYGPYPYRRMIVVEGDFPDGMEFTGLVFVSRDWFRAWTGIPDDWLTLITAHEVAHQWWYGMVGNDQGQYPYLDESLAIYSELLFVERYYPEDREWWWNFRVNAYAPQGYVDTPIYDFYSPRGYIDTVYLQGARMMDALRADLGDEAFLVWLRRYADRMRNQIAYPVDLWGALPDSEYLATAQTRAAYLRHPDLLPPPDLIP